MYILEMNMRFEDAVQMNLIIFRIYIYLLARRRVCMQKNVTVCIYLFKYMRIFVYDRI